MSSSNKPAFQIFVEANQALLQCYNKVSVDEYKKMSEGTRDSVCASEKQRVKDIVGSNSLVMSNLIRERIDILNKIAAEQANK